MVRHYFHSKVWQPESLTEVTISSSSDLFQIQFQLFKVTRSIGWCEEEEEDGNVTCKELEEEPKLVAAKQTKPLDLSWPAIVCVDYSIRTQLGFFPAWESHKMSSLLLLQGYTRP